MTIAEGIAVKTAGHLTRQIVGDLVDDILLVGEASIERAIALLQSVEKTVVEGAGAAALAAVIENPGLFSGLNVALPLTGGNIDPRVYANVILRDLVRQGQLLHIEVPISDQPGALAELATVLGKEGANIVDMSHERLNLALNPRGAAIGLVIELQDESHGKRVLAGLAERGFTPVPRQVG
jgi:threonine dehydratase